MQGGAGRESNLSEDLWRLSGTVFALFSADLDDDQPCGKALVLRMGAKALRMINGHECPCGPV